MPIAELPICHLCSVKHEGSYTLTLMKILNKINKYARDYVLKFLQYNYTSL